MAATQPVPRERTMMGSILSMLISSYVTLPPISKDHARELLQTMGDIDDQVVTGDTRTDSFVASYTRVIPNPIVSTTNSLYSTDKPSEEGHPITGEGATRPVVWIVVPFQTTPGDGRDVQRDTFIGHMVRLREYLARKGIVLRVRFAEQAFTGFRRQDGQHPLAEKTMPGEVDVSTPKFNRGAILNAALSQITTGQCIFTHDVDLVPIHEEDGMPPSYDAYATPIPDDMVLHLAGGWERYNEEGRTEFSSYLGGIAGMTPVGWRRVNGYPNDFFGWGGEDDEFRNRVKEIGARVNSEYYDRDRFRLRDLEDLTRERKLQVVQKQAATYNVIKDELVRLHRDKGGLGAGGLAESPEVTRVISWDTHSEHPWIDTVLVAILPSAYPVLPPSAYTAITEEQIYGPKSNASYRALARYRTLVSTGYNWGMGDTTEDMAEYDAIRAKETIYGPGKRPDHRSVQGWRSRLRGLKDINGTTTRILPDGSQMSLHSLLWMDPTGAFSISYPETAETMASILASTVPAGSSIVDMTACIGGNTSYFSYYFQRVTAIEIAPHRQEILEHNLRLLHPGKEDQVISIPAESLVTTPEADRPRVSIVIGDSLQILTQNVTYSDLARADPLGQVLFLDPPWGGPNYMNLPRPLQLEMVTRDGGAVSAANFLRPILARIRAEQQILPRGKGLLSDIHYVGMKVPDEYDIDGLRDVLRDYRAVATDPFLVPDKTGRNRVYFIVMTLL